MRLIKSVTRNGGTPAARSISGFGFAHPCWGFIATVLSAISLSAQPSRVPSNPVYLFILMSLSVSHAGVRVSVSEPYGNLATSARDAWRYIG